MLFVIFALTTGIVCDSAYFILPLVALAAGGSVYFYYRFNWKPVLLVTIILSYHFCLRVAARESHYWSSDETDC